MPTSLRTIASRRASPSATTSLPGHNEPWVDEGVVPRASEAFRTMLDGDGKYEEDDARRRYRFEGFDIIVRKDLFDAR